MARSAEAFRPLAHDLHADESLVQERGSRSGIREVAVGADRADQDRGVRARLDLDQGASGRDGRSKKNGPQAIGKSRGGWNTKVHLVAANARTAITFALSPGHAHDAPEGRALLAEQGPMQMNRLLRIMDESGVPRAARAEMIDDYGWEANLVPPETKDALVLGCADGTEL